MNLTRLYGQKAINVQDGRLQYFSKSGVIDVPEHLVRRVIDQGFSTMPFADLTTPESTGAADEHPAPAAPDPIATQPATQQIALPVEHPQVGESAAIATKEQLRAAELRLKQTGA